MLLETERLILRPIRATDQSDLLEYHRDERVVRYIPWSVRCIVEVEHAISVGTSGLHAARAISVMRR